MPWTRNSSQGGTDFASQLISMKLSALPEQLGESVFRSKLRPPKLDKLQGVVFV